MEDDPVAAIAESSGSPPGPAQGKERTMSKRGSGGAMPQKRDMSGRHDARITQRESSRSLRKEERAPGTRRAPTKGVAERAVVTPHVNRSAGQDPPAPARAPDPSIAGGRHDDQRPTLTEAE